jgi:hypothetical protein
LIFKGLQEKVLVPLSPQVPVPNLGKTLKIKAFSGFFVSSAWQKNEGFGTLKTLNRNPTLSRGYKLSATIPAIAQAMYGIPYSKIRFRIFPYLICLVENDHHIATFYRVSDNTFF